MKEALNWSTACSNQHCQKRTLSMGLVQKGITLATSRTISVPQKLGLVPSPLLTTFWADRLF